VGDDRNRKQRLHGRREKFTPLPESVLTRNLGGESIALLSIPWLRGFRCMLTPVGHMIFIPF
jgi:hypothetical protein